MYIGITAEWNPFHSGHAHMLRSLKNLFPDAPIISAMSGSFVQRGEPAIFDKWTRAKWALMFGVDAVIELPVLCVLQSADKFAASSVSLLHNMGCTHIAFGAESLNSDTLHNAAHWSLQPDFNLYFHQFLGKGLSYASAVTKSMEIRYPEISRELTRPNNLLGFLYVQAALKQNLPLSFIVIERNTHYPASATTARKHFIAGESYPLLPEQIQTEIHTLMNTGHILSYARYEDSCLLLGRLTKKESLRDSRLFSEGLENKWYKEIQQASLPDVFEAIKSKRYLYSRLKRIAASLLLSSELVPSPFSHSSFPKYARLLALRNTKSFILNKSNLPVITGAAKALRTLQEKKALESFSIDLRATDIQSYCMKNKSYRTGRLDFYHSPVIR